MDRDDLLRWVQQKSSADLAKAIAHKCGAGHELTANQKFIADRIGDFDHYVFILVDGFGYNLLNRLPANGFLRTLSPIKINSVFPSTTSSAITTFATASWPSEHGMIEWWTYLEKHKLTFALLPGLEQKTSRPYSEFGVDMTDVMYWQAWLKSSHCSGYSYVPKQLAKSFFSQKCAEGGATVAYEKLHDVINMVIQNIDSSKGKTYSYIYYADIDSISHEFGTDHPIVDKCLQEIDSFTQELKASLPPQARIILSADHGQTNINSNIFKITDSHPILEYLETPPSGGARSPIFHVRPGLEEKFKKYFNETFGEYFDLYTREEMINSGLLGPMSPNPNTVSRLGQFMGIPKRETAFYYSPDGQQHIKRGFHGGPSKDEIEVPLFLI